MTDEVRVTSETGGQKGQKLARFDLIPADAIRQVAEHYGIGARKYEDRNWERGYEWSLTFGAMMRHAWAWWGGEDVDPETGSHHLAAVAFHALAGLTFADTHREMDDRPRKDASLTADVAEAVIDRIELNKKAWSERLRVDTDKHPVL